MLIQLLVGPRGILRRRLRRDPVVLTDEECLQGEQFGIFVGPHVAREEELVIGHDMGIVGIGKPCRIERQQVACARAHPAAHEFAERRRPGRVGAVDLRPVDEGRDRVGLLPWVASGGAGGGIVGRPRHRDRHRAGAVGIERRVA